MFCPSCGKHTPDTAQFCTSCGAYLTSSSPAVADAGGGAGPLATSPAITGPGGTVLSMGQPFAGFWIRFLAHMIDGFLLNAVAFLLIVPLAVLFGIASVGAGRIHEDVLAGLFLLIWVPVGLALSWIYEAGFTSSTRQATPGKMALSLIVTDERGARISFGRATGRFFAKVLSGLTMSLGFLIQIFTAKRQALHDLLAGTLVVRKPPGP